MKQPDRSTSRGKAARDALHDAQVRDAGDDCDDCDDAATLPEVAGVTPTTELTLSDDEHAFLQQLRLYAASGPDAGKEFSSRGQRMIVGTHSSADAMLSDRSVSRFHCELYLQNGHAKIRDLGSRNGTFVDGVRVESAYLQNAAVIAIGRSRVRFEVRPDRVLIPLSSASEYGDLVGGSLAMRAVFAILERAAQTDSTVLIEGETGTGKELAAEAIHFHSRRSSGPFIVVDCSAIPPDLLESELFGHEKGAFTGAVTSRAGAFSAARGGTVFLDELGELGSDLQPKLLRALERRQVKPVGSDRYHDIDVRVLAATNRNLHAEVNAKRFRSDLYYRLAVIHVQLPPLRERLEDLPALVERILDRLQVSEDDAQVLHGTDFVASLGKHSWPGNVRELRNYVERCVAMRRPVPHIESNTEGDIVDDLSDPSLQLREARERWTSVLEHRYITRLLEREGANVSAAARAAGVGRGYFYRLLWRHGLR